MAVSTGLACAFSYHHALSCRSYVDLGKDSQASAHKYIPIHPTLPLQCRSANMVHSDLSRIVYPLPASSLIAAEYLRRADPEFRADVIYVDGRCVRFTGFG